MASVEKAMEIKLDSEFFAKTEADGQSWGNDLEHRQSLILERKRSQVQKRINVMDRSNVEVKRFGNQHIDSVTISRSQARHL